MQLLILGSGGTQPPPRPGCMCRVCKEARTKGIPYYRTGPSLYLPEHKILFDTPEEIREQLNRENIGHLNHVFISHWHPDHTMGLRIFEQMNYSFLLKPPQKTILHISRETTQSINKLLPSFIPLYERRNIIEVNTIKEGQVIALENLKITPYTIPKLNTFIFKIQQGEKCAIYAPCDIQGFPICEDLMYPDVLIFQLGYFKECVTDTIIQLYGDEEMSFDENLQLIKLLKAKKAVFMHIEEDWGKSYDDYKRMEDALREFNVEFAYDSMMINL